MKFLSFVLKHLRRNVVRTSSTIVAIGLCVFTFCALRSVLAQIDGFVESRSPRRLITKNVMGHGLPLSHAERMRATPGVRRVAAGFIFGGFLQARKEGRADPGSGVVTDWTTYFHNFAVDAEPYFAMNPELEVPPDQFREFMMDRQGCVVGRKLADKFGWKIGDRFFLESVVPALRKPSGPFEFVVRAFMDADLGKHPGTQTDAVLFHHRYLDESVDAVRGWTLMYMVEIDDPDRSAEIAAEIDALFENSGEQTLTESEKAFATEFTAQAGDLATLLNGIGLAVCFTILLVTANTMAMAVRERRTEIAVLKTLGFSSPQVMALVMAEALLLGALGGALGLAATSALFWALTHTEGRTFAALGVIELRPPAAFVGFGVALLLGLAAGFMPAWAAYRAKVTEMLRVV